MSTTLDVINACLATLGEAPLNSEASSHELKASALRLLAKSNRSVQSTGWWFNTETTTLVPSPLNSQIQLSGDTIQFRSGITTKDTLVMNASKPWLVQRGQRLYDTRNQTYVLTETVIGELIREVPFQDLPPVVNDLVLALTVLKFQSDFDADSNRQERLGVDYKMASAAARAENIRQSSVNLIAMSTRLSRIKRATRRF